MSDPLVGVVHGPNLNRLGWRNPAKYGLVTLEDINDQLQAHGREAGYSIRHVQSNHEGALIDWIHHHAHHLDALVVNPAGLTSGGYSLLDAVRDTRLPLGVVHLSSFPALDGRERDDIFAPQAAVYVTGAGWRGYLYAAEAVSRDLGASSTDAQRDSPVAPTPWRSAAGEGS